MVKVRGPLFSLFASGWLGRFFYRTHGVVHHPYPFALLGFIRKPYRMPAFGLRPYPPFIAKYYYPLGWLYENRRTWHGIQPTVRRVAFVSNPDSQYQIQTQDNLRQAVLTWKSMDNEIKDVYNKMTYPRRLDGYRRFIRLYLLGRKAMPIYWGTLQRSASDPSLIEESAVMKNNPQINYPFQFYHKQAFNFVLHQGSGFPANPVEGQLFYNSSDDTVYVFSNNVWRPLGESQSNYWGMLQFRRLDRYHSSPLVGTNSTTTATMSQNTIYAIPFYTPKPVRAVLIGVRLTATALGNIRLGIYHDDGTTYPGNLLVDAGEVTSNYIGFIGLPIDVRFSTNSLYWLVAHFSSGPMVVASTRTGQAVPILGFQDVNLSYTVQAYSKTVSYGPLPSTFYSGASYHVGSFPVIALYLTS